MKLKIPQATSRGYIECEENGCFDWTYPTSKVRRGRVQGGAYLPYVDARTIGYLRFLR